MDKSCVKSCLVRATMTIILVLVASCKPTVPSEYIQPGEMEDILYDYHISQAMVYQRQQKNPKETAGNSPMYKRNLYYQTVLKKYGVTEAEFDSSLVYYYSHADKLQKIYKRISERMEKNAVSLGTSVSDINKYSQFKADGDTANIWNSSTSALLTPAPPYNRLDFKIESDTTFKKGDSFLLNFMTDFIYQGGTKDAIIYIAIRYDNDSISTHNSHVAVSGLSQLRIPGNQQNDIKEINGFIYLNRGNDNSNTLKLMFINQIQLIRFHKKTFQITENDITDSEENKITSGMVKDTIHPPHITNDTARRPIQSNTMVKSRRLPIDDNAKEIQKNSSK